MPLLEDILAQKQALIILLEQHGRKRSEILASLNLPTNRSGLEQLASQSSIGEQLLAQSDVLTDLLARVPGSQRQQWPVDPGAAGRHGQSAENPHRRRTASALRCQRNIFQACETASAQSGLSLSMSHLYQDAKHAGKMLASRSQILSGD
jgi:hypothetical protein